MKITAEKFKEATGCDPEQDDLERCNCDKAGQVLHSMCGWDEKHSEGKMIDRADFEACRILINDIQALESRAHRLKAHETGQALNRAKNTIGWELARATERLIDEQTG